MTTGKKVAIVLFVLAALAALGYLLFAASGDSSGGDTKSNGALPTVYGYVGAALTSPSGA